MHCRVEALVATARTPLHPRPFTMAGREGLRRRRSVCREAPLLPLFIGKRGRGWLLIREMAAPLLQYGLSAPSVALRIKADPLLQPSALGFRPWHSSPCPPHPPPTTPNACGTRGRYVRNGRQVGWQFPPRDRGAWAIHGPRSEFFHNVAHDVRENQKLAWAQVSEEAKKISRGQPLPCPCLCTC
mgnify:CR=1 FL=1